MISYKMLIITRISNENTNELTIYGTLCRKVTIFYRQTLASLFQMQEKLKACRISKLNFSSRCVIADDKHIKIVWLHEHLKIEWLHSANIIFYIFEIMSIYLNIIQWKYLRIALILSITEIKPVYKFSNSRLH